MHLGITYASFGIVQQHGQLARPQIQPAQPSAITIASQRLAVWIQAKATFCRIPVIATVIAEVDVPVIATGYPGREDDFVDAAHVTVEHGSE